MQSVNTNMYWETYDDQKTDDFDFIGVDAENLLPLTDIDDQVAELRRLYGSRTSIYVFKKREM